METKAEILELVRHYQKQFSDEADRIQPFLHFVNSYIDQDLFCRENFTGHLTASAFILNPASDALLLLEHKSLNRWLQPGGHIDAADISLLAAALREVEEETSLLKNDLHTIYNYIFDIDSHYIPANPKKQEPSHIHHDVRFLFRCLKPDKLQINPNESNACKWVPVIQLFGNDDLCRIAKKFMSEPHI